MNIVIGADHRGYRQKEFIKEHMWEPSITWIDVGAFDQERSDYPTFAVEAVTYVVQKKADRGILLCGSGNGMAITANRYKGIYAGLAWNEQVARLAREHDKVNMLVIPSDYVSHDVAAQMIRVWLEADFLGGRYQDRIEMINALGGLTI